ncbi:MULTISPECIES: hypothetical protein [Streptomyces]|uniref:hypothetical protein n=1 Tax=Streptomyces scabiei TaxID=1930 RepID=UPI001B3299DC|nr:MULTISPECIES: hypothetical protein [Streptomyces]MBP5888715.1 hypothetical protein [Streptomyces sp. LBUM 1487]MDW8478417.1 hypothetical protein [Streptomyces scabiei]
MPIALILVLVVFGGTALVLAANPKQPLFQQLFGRLRSAERTPTPEQQYWAEANRRHGLTNDQLRRRAMLLGGTLGLGTSGDVTTIDVSGENELGPTFTSQRYCRDKDGLWRAG